MKLRELAAKLLGKPDHEIEVEFLVINKTTGAIVCCDLNGPSTTDLMRVLARKKGSTALVE